MHPKVHVFGHIHEARGHDDGIDLDNRVVRVLDCIRMGDSMGFLEVVLAFVVYWWGRLWG